MKALPSILLGVMLLTSLVSISYATPVMQPQGSGDLNSCVNLKPNDPNWYNLGCAGAAHQNGNDNPPHHCVVSRIGTDTCVCFSAGPRADGTCCGTSISPHGLEVSDIHADVPPCF